MAKILQFPTGKPDATAEASTAEVASVDGDTQVDGDIQAEPHGVEVESTDSDVNELGDDFGDLDDVVTIEPELAIAGDASIEVASQQMAPEEKVLPPPKFGFTRVRRSRKKPKAEHQLDLFPEGKILAFPAPMLDPFEEGLLRDEEGQVEGARDLYETAIAVGDRVADASCNLGIIDYQSGDVEAAFDCFRTALKHDPRHWESHYNLANLYFDTGQYDPARVHYEVAAEIAPDSRNIFFNLGLALALQGDYDAAIDALSSYRYLTPGEEGEAAEDLLAALRKTRQAAGPTDESLA
jgi:tetratricopeptide (TPR) repeat protein